MAEFPAMPLWTDAYLADTTHLTTIEHGTYLLLLMAMWRTSSKSLPADDAKLARYAKLTKAQWQRLKPTIIEFFDLNEETMTYTQGRLTDEAIAVRQHSKLQSDKARRRWLKNKETGDAAAMPERCPHTHTHTHSKKDSSIYTASSPNGGAPNGAAPNGHHAYRFDEWWACWDIPGAKKNRAASERKYKAAIKSNTVAHDELCNGVRRYMAWCRKERFEVRYIKAPDVWLNKGCWADELPGTGPPPSRRTMMNEDLTKIGD